MKKYKPYVRRFPEGKNIDLKKLISGVKSGKYLVHVRTSRRDREDIIKYGIYPSAGEFLRSTEAWQWAEEHFGEGPELIFFADDFKWVGSSILRKVHKGEDLEVVFVEKNETIQQSLGNRKVKLYNGKIVDYDLSPIADYESDLFRSEPAGVERGDWYTNESQEVLAIVPAEEVLELLK